MYIHSILGNKRKKREIREVVAWGKKTFYDLKLL